MKELQESEGVYSTSCTGIWRGRGRKNVQSGSDDDWFHFGHLDHTRFGGWKTGGGLT